MMKQRLLLLAVFIGITAVIGFAIYRMTLPVPLVFQGQVEAREIDIAAKIAGRVSDVLVREGDKVEKGDSLFIIDSPELNAKMTQASSGRNAAVAMSDKASHGAREEEIQMAKFAWAGAESAAQLAQKTFERFDSLFKEGLITAQQHDEAQTAAKAANDAQQAARARYNMAINGARQEDKTAALAVVDQAQGLVAEVSAYAAETNLKAPISAEVTQVLIDIGELAPAGFPVVTLVDLDDAWVVLNVRENHLVHFQMGANLSATVPGLGNEQVNLSVYYIAPQADFATWRATRYSQGFDVKTFEVRLRSDNKIQGLRPGMSVLFNDID